jgi:hypothetical protein
MSQHVLNGTLKLLVAILVPQFFADVATKWAATVTGRSTDLGLHSTSSFA